MNVFPLLKFCTAVLLLSLMDMKMNNKTIYPNSSRRGCIVHSCRTVSSIVQDHKNNYLYEGVDQTFPGPLLSSKMKMKDLLTFIQKKIQEALQRVEESEQKEVYFFWLIMDLMCTNKGKILTVDITKRLFEGYSCMRSKAPNVCILPHQDQHLSVLCIVSVFCVLQRVCDDKQDDWCLPLARLLCSTTPLEELRLTVIRMAQDLGCRGQVFAAHICCVVAQIELGSYIDSSFDLIGYNSSPNTTSAISDAIQRSEVYEYVLFMISGSVSPNFQKYKVFHAGMLVDEGHSDLALEYYECIARAVTTTPFIIALDLAENIILMSEELLQGQAKKPEWLLKLWQIHAPKAPEHEDISGVQSSYIQLTLTPKKELFAAGYIILHPLGQGSFGSVYAGIRKSDKKMVAIKFVAKSDKYIIMPGQADSVPREVALMLMVSMEPRCENIVDIVDWFDLPTCFVLVLERPGPCIDLEEFCKWHNGRIPEALVRKIMWQVVEVVQHCCNRGVFHRDIKADNLLIDTKTLQVKLIDFGCGDLLKDSHYTEFAGAPMLWPPECFTEGQCLGLPATVWGLGVLLCYLLCGQGPFEDISEIAAVKFTLPSYLSQECKELILWCLEKDPDFRPTLENIRNSKWFERERLKYVQAGDCTLQRTLS